MARTAAKKSAAPADSPPVADVPSTARKAPAKKAAARKTPTAAAATKADGTKPAAKPAPKAAPKATGRKAAGTKAAGTKTAASKAGRSTAATPAAASVAAPEATLAVKPGEDPWTAEELAEVRGELDTDRARLRTELNLAEHELHDLMRDAGDGAGNDQADVGSTTFERDHEMSLANNARDMLAQTERAIARIEDGSYGVCESCGEAIGKMRIMAFPRATLCLSCKQREERR